MVDLDLAIELSVKAVKELGLMDNEAMVRELDKVAEYVEKNATVDFYRGFLHGLVIVANMGNPMVNFTYTAAISALFAVVGERWEEAKRDEQAWIEGQI